MLGSARWRLPGGQSKTLSAKDAGLVALLAIEGPQARDALSDRLWPQAGRTAAGNNLRQRIKRLRDDTGVSIFQTGTVVKLDADIVVDVHTVSQQPADVLLHAGDLLAGVGYVDNDELDDWLRGQRERLRRERADALAGWAHALEDRGELAAALRLAEAIVALAPLLEHGWRRLMRLHYLRGDRAAAIEAFERLEATLREQTGARPDAETMKLLQTVERASTIGPGAARVLPASLMRPPRLIGREREWRSIADAWAAGQPVLLLGDAGLGKSRLLADFCRERPGVLREQGRPGDAQAPYAVLSRLLQEARSKFGVEPDSATRQELARIAPDFGPAPAAPTQQHSLWRAAEKLLASAAAAGLTALIIDDLHYADLATVEALRWLSGSPALADLRFAFAARPLDEASMATLPRDWLDDAQRPLAIELNPLSAADVDALLATLDLPQHLSTFSAAALHRRAGGHPLFTLETLRQAFLNGHHPGANDVAGPAQVQSLLDRRLRQLPADALALLRVAAVAGVDLTAQRAAQLLGRSVFSLADAWMTLEQANVLQGQRFAHDLMLEAALRLVPPAVRAALHADLASLLVGDPQVPPARLAEHWEAAGHWSQAGSAWHTAGVAARLAGRLAEQHALLERAATCHRKANDSAAEFEALYADLDSILFRQGSAAVLAALPRLAALAPDGERHLRCQLANLEALIDLERSADAVAAAELAVRAAASSPAWLGDALGLQGMALAQHGRVDEALAAEREATVAARAAGNAAQTLRVTRSLAYVLYASGRIADAVPAQRETLSLAEALGDAAEAAAAEGSLAALMAIVGDMPAAHVHALGADRRYRDMGLSNNSSVGCVNLISLGQAAAYLGRFAEALAALEEAVKLAGDEAVVSAQAKARICLANLWLTLGHSGAARGLVAELPAEILPGMRMQAHLILARAAAMDGLSDATQLELLGQLMDKHADLPLVQSAWVEWSYQGDAATVVAQLRKVRAQIEPLGMAGVVRTLSLRELCRLAEIDSAGSELARIAHELLPFIATGMSAKTYPPEAWLILARAFEQAGESGPAQACRNAALGWIRDLALPKLPAGHRDSFLRGNPVNRALLEGRP